MSEHSGEHVAKFMVSLYNRGYKDGHHDTVEGQYVDVFRQDMDTYHSDVVSEWLEDNLNTMFYTTPPQRKPLTDEQIRDGYNNCEWTHAPAAHWFEAGVKFSEAAHGIKE